MKKQIDFLIRVPQPGDETDLALCWLDAATYYNQLNPDLFQIPVMDGLAHTFEDMTLHGNSDQTIIRVAEHGRKVVGFIRASIHPPDDDAEYQLMRDLSLKRLVIGVLVVKQDYWNLGIGTQLMEAAETWGREKGAAISLLGTYYESPVSVPFYEQHLDYRRKSINFRKSL